MAFIEFADVKKTYRSGEVEVEALHGVSFTVEKGEICVIVGPSGAGKTTLLNILGGMDTLTAGRILLDGEEISAYPPKRLIAYRRRDVGFVFQFYNLIENLTALENVELAAQICPAPLDAAETLRAVGLGERLRNFPSQLSGGEQQRVAIARALINKPQILIADEPTGNLDPQNSWDIMQLLEEVNANNGTTIIVVTHNREIVDRMKKRVIHMDHGEIINDVDEGGYFHEA